MYSCERADLSQTPCACGLQQEGFASDSVRMIQTLRKEAPNVQILLFSATFSERVKNFALRIVGPEANQVFVPKEELSLDVIKQYCVVRSHCCQPTGHPTGFLLCDILSGVSALLQYLSAASSPSRLMMGTVQVCPTTMDKTSVLRDMIFPQAEKVRRKLMSGIAASFGPMGDQISHHSQYHICCRDAAWPDDHLRADPGDRAQPAQSGELCSPELFAFSSTVESLAIPARHVHRAKHTELPSVVARCR